MLKRGWFIFFTGIMFLTPLYKVAAVSELEKIEKQLAQIRKQTQEAERKKNQSERQRKNIKQKKELTEKDIGQLMKQIDGVSSRIDKTSVQLTDTERKVDGLAAELEIIKDRIAKRKELIESRIRLTYMSGVTSYLDLFLASTGFMDFLDRVEMVQAIVSQDNQILDNHEDDKKLAESKKKEVDAELRTFKELYAKLESTRQDLDKKEKEKEGLVAKLQKDAESLEDITEEQEKQLMRFAKKSSDLYKKRDELRRASQKNAGPAPKSSIFSGGKFSVPLKSAYRISSGFGPRVHPITGEKGKAHNGIDMAAPKGTSIYAADTGTVILAQSWSGYGNCVMIDHGGGLWTLYGHIRQGGIMVEKGQQVKRGDKIAEVGSTGQSTGNHLHFEVRFNEHPVNPVPYLK